MTANVNDLLDTAIDQIASILKGITSLPMSEKLQIKNVKNLNECTRTLVIISRDSRQQKIEENLESLSNEQLDKYVEEVIAFKRDQTKAKNGR